MNRGRLRQQCSRRTSAAALAAVFLMALAISRPLAASLTCSSSASSTAPKPTTSFLRGYWALLRGPVSVAADSDGTVFIADAVRSTLTERGFDGSVRSEIQLPERPLSVGVDATRGDGPVYVGDASGQVREYTRDFSSSRLLGAAAGEFQMPVDIAVDPLSGRIWVADARAKNVKIFSPQGVRLQTIAGASASETFGAPTAVAMLVTNTIQEVLISDQPNSRLLVFALDGTYRRCLGRAGSTPGRLGFPKGLAVDRLNRIYVADTFQGDVQVIDRNGGFIAALSGFGERPGELQSPADVAIDSRGRLYVATTNNQRLDVFGIDAFSDPESVIPVAATALPDLWPLAEGTVASLRIEAPGTALAGVEPSSILVNGLPPAAVRIEDANRDGALDLMLDVNVPALLPTLPAIGEGALHFSARLGTMTLQGTATVTVRTIDADADGVNDTADTCPDTARGAAVDTAGCAVAQLCPCQAAWSNHSAYVACVRSTAVAFQRAGWITLKERKQTVKDAAQSQCGVPR